MHQSKTYTDDFNGKSYSVLMFQHASGGKWTIEIQLFDESDSKIGKPWRDADHSYDSDSAAQNAGIKWAEEQLG